MHSSVRLVSLAISCTWLLLVRAAHGDLQVTQRLEVPAAPLAGDASAYQGVLNPGGLAFLPGAELELALSIWDREAKARSGAGVYLATPVVIPFLPRMALGLGAEVFQTAPAPLHRLLPAGHTTVAYATELSRGVAAAGINWRHFWGNHSIADGLDSLDVGLSLRLGAHWALGATVHDGFAPRLLDGSLVARRYAAELAVRPWGNNRFEVALGAQVVERPSPIINPQLRWSWQPVRGLRLLGNLSTFHDGDTQRETRATLGVEMGLGQASATLFGMIVPADTRWLGGTVATRFSRVLRPSLLSARRVVRLELGGKMPERELVAWLMRLEKLGQNPHTKAVLIKMGNLEAGWATLQDLHAGLHALRRQGKPVFVHLHMASMRSYFVAAAADQIFFDPAGGVRLLGLATTVRFIKNLLDHLGIGAQFEKIAEYKSAPEMFTHTAPSPEAETMRENLLKDSYQCVLDELAADRGVATSQVERWIHQGLYTAEEALNAGLAHRLVPDHELHKIASAIAAAPVATTPEREAPAQWMFPQIAVVYIDGDIIAGTSMTLPGINHKLVGSDTISQAIAWARENPRIRALVLRIDSPGGDALASEQIAEQVHLTRSTKPTVVSMGNIAASGGYFVAAGAHHIFAQPTTLTGSIGIYTGKFDGSQLLHHLGLTWHTYKQGPHADMEGLYRGYTDDERAAIRQKLGYFYHRFLEFVARGRGLTIAQVDAVGRGHVWTGRQAYEHKLVDALGGFRDALEEAKRRAGLHENAAVALVSLPSEPPTLLTLLRRICASPSFDSLFLEGLSNIVPPSMLLMAPNTPQARLPWIVEVN